MRIFIAIELPDQVKDRLFRLLQEISRVCERGRFVAKNNFHLTLKFIGEVEEQRYQQIKEVVSQVGKITSPFQLQLAGVGTFPSGRKKIVWIGIEAGSELYAIQYFLEKELERYAISRETRKYTPHITLGREVIFRPNVDLDACLYKKMVADNEIITVMNISIMESVRKDGALVYYPRHTIKLKET